MLAPSCGLVQEISRCDIVALRAAAVHAHPEPLTSDNLDLHLASSDGENRETGPVCRGADLRQGSPTLTACLKTGHDCRELTPVAGTGASLPDGPLGLECGLRERRRGKSFVTTL